MERVAGGRITPPAGWRTHSRKEKSAVNGAATDAGRTIPLPRAAEGRIPAALSSVAMKALRLDKSERYSTVAALSADIEKFQSGFATSAEDAGAFRQITLLVLRHRTVAASLAVLLVLSIGFVVKVMASEHRATQSAETAVIEKEAARRALARSQVSLAEAAYRESNGSAMRLALGDVPADLRDGDSRYLHARADTSQAAVVPQKDWFIGAAPHPSRPGVFALASMEHTICFVEARTGRQLSSFPTSLRQQRTIHYRTLAFSPDGGRLAVGGLSDGGVGIYDAVGGQCLVEWDAPETDVVGFSHDGFRTLDVSLKSTLTVRDAGTGTALWHAQPCSRAVFTPSGEVIAAHAVTLRVLDGTNGTILQQLPFPRSRGQITDLTLSPDGAILYFATTEGYVIGMKLADESLTFEDRVTGRVGHVFLKMGAGGRTLVAATYPRDGRRTVRVMDVHTGAPPRALLGSVGQVEALAVHPLTDDVIVTGPDTRTWNCATRAPRWAIKGDAHATAFWDADEVFLPGRGVLRLSGPGDVTSPLWAPQDEFNDAVHADAAGACAAVGRSGAAASTILLLSKSAGVITPGHTLRPPVQMKGLRLHPAGEFVAVFDHYKMVEIYDTKTGQPVARCDPDGLTTIKDIRWAGPGRLVGIGTLGERGLPNSEERIVSWESKTGRQLRRVRATAAIDCLAIAPGGRKIAEGGLNKKVRLRDGETLEVLSEFRAHDGPITALAFHSVQPVLATGSADLTIRLWNLEDASLMEELRPSSKEPQSLRFSPSGARLASADAAGEVRVWALEK